MASSNDVMTSRVLMEVILQYQHGVTMDIIPFIVWEHTRMFRRADRSCDELVDILVDLDRLLAPWYDQYDVERLETHLFVRLSRWKVNWIPHHAAWSGRIDVLRLLDPATMISSVMDLAAACNQLQIIQANLDYPASVRAIDWAAQNGHFEMVELLMQRRYDGCSDRALVWASGRGHLKIVQYLIQKKTTPLYCSEAIDWAAMYGHLNVVKFLHSAHFHCTTFAMDMAAHNGHEKIVHFLHHNRPEGCTTNAMDYAAKNGHLKILEFLHVNRSEGYTTLALYWAQQRRHYDVVQYIESISQSNSSRQLSLPQQYLKWMLCENPQVQPL